MEAAESPSARAVVAWDHFRARVAALPEDKKKSAFEAAAVALSRISPDRRSARHRTTKKPTE
jgi:hypothetical protein